MGIFKKDKPPKDTNSVEFRRYMAKKLNERKIRYVLEKEETVNRVIGKDGFFSVFGGEISVICGEKTLFRSKVDTLSACWEFLSLEGVTITGYDLTTGKERTILAYYKYYRS
ncbi:MAG: hypothetical protein GX148_08130 [Clostridiales bacterium]|jgi:hypothetical protein|nr:hypothetical protein [Clostridiales bacterium]